MHLQRSYLRGEPLQTIEIQLEKRGPGPYGSYTTGDFIEGLVWIQTDPDVKLRAQDVEINFCGDSQVVSEGVFLPISTYRKKKFLQLQQPIDDACLLPTNCSEIGSLYQIPFSFVVPDQLPVQACQHFKDGWDMNRGHLMLPPTLGKGPSGKKQFPLDDMGSGSMSIVYSVQVTLPNECAKGDQAKGPWNSAFNPVTVIPMSNGGTHDRKLSIPRALAHWNRLPKSSELIFGKGLLSARAWDPRPIELRFPCQAKSDLSPSLIKMELDFQSVQHELPPSLLHVLRKLIVHTTAHSMPFRPTPTGPACQSRPETNSRTVSLGKMDISSVKFLPGGFVDLSIVDEEKALLNLSHDCGGSDAPSLYTTSIEVPIILPNDKIFVPSFESCMISRSYEVDIRVYYSSGWKGLGTSSLSFRLPLQIVS